MEIVLAMSDISDFLHPRYPYRGHVSPENLMFNRNLQEFSQKVSYICALETAGKIPPEIAYQQIAELWEKLELSQKNLVGRPN